MIATSRDALFDGAISFTQPARGAGYRVNVDALLLAAFASHPPGKPARRAIDLGAGAGAVGLALLHLGGARSVVLVEKDADLADLAARNLADNGWADRGRAIASDVTDADDIGAADLVVCNPPYVEEGRGRPAKHPGRRAGRAGSLAVFVDAARRAMGKRARACFVYPAREAVTLFETLRARGLEPKRIRAVHATPKSAARVLLVETQCAKAGGLVVEPPLVEITVDS